MSIDYQLHHVQICYPLNGDDLMRTFYIDALGMREIPKPPELAKRGGFWVNAGPFDLHLSPEMNFTPAHRAHPGIIVSDLDGLAKLLEQAGTDITWDANFIGFRRFHAFDPHRNRLEFMAPEN